MTDNTIPKELERLLIDALEAEAKGIKIFDITKYDSAALSIRIRGKKWEGLVDKSVAQFIIDAEKQLRDALDSQGIKYAEAKRGIIRLEVKDGSLDMVQHVADVIEQLKTMSPQEVITVTSALAVIIGAFKMDSIIAAFKSDKVRRIEADEKVKLAEVEADRTEKMMEAQAQQMKEVVEGLTKLQTREYALEQPRRSLVNKMDEGDTIESTGKKRLSKKEAKKRFEKSDRSKMEHYYIDGTYIIEELDTPESGDWKVKLKYGDQTFKAELKLDTQQMDKFVEGYTQARRENKSVSRKLQVTATINNKGVSKADVVGIGKKRSTATSLGKALAIARRSKKK